MGRRKAAPLTAQRVKEALISERKQKPCVKCGLDDHGYLNKGGKRSCTKDDNYLRDEQREIWAQHELNPLNEDAVVEARLAAANATVEATGESQAQEIPIRTVPGAEPTLRKGQSSTSSSRGPGSSVRIESKERPSHPNLSPDVLDTPATSEESSRGKTFVPSNDEVVGKNEGKGKGKKEPIRPKALLVPADYADRKPDGTVGDKIRTVVNFFKIDKLPKTVFKYTIDLPEVRGREVGSRDAKRLLIEKLLLRAPYIRNNSTHVATDFNSLIFSTVDLFSTNGQPGIVGRVVATSLAPQTGSTEPPITINVEYKESIPCSDILRRYVTNQARDFDYADVVTALNVFTYKYLSLPQSGVTVFGGNKFFINVPAGKQEDRDILLSPGLHIRRGFFASTRPGMDSTFLNVNVAASAFFNEVNLAAFVGSHFGLVYDNSRLNESQARIFGRVIRGLKVRFTYDPQTKQELQDDSGRKRRVAGIGLTADQQMFSHSTLGNISVQNYFNNCKHVSVRISLLLTHPPIDLHLNVRFWMLPTINVGSANKDRPEAHVYIPPEYLHIEPNQLFSGKLEGTQTQNMIRFACQRPNINRDIVQTHGMRRLGIKPADAHLQANFDLDIQQTLAEINARILPVPNLLYASGSTAGSLRPDRGSWNLEHRRFHQPGILKTLHVLALQIRQEDVASIVQEPSVLLATALRGYGLQTNSEPNIVTISSSPQAGTAPFATRFEAVLQAGLVALEKARPGPIELIVIVLDRRDVEKYSVIKRWADSRVGIPTVCSVRDKFIKKSNDTFGNLALKINIKMGGINHVLGQGDFGKLLKMRTMIMGADVTHPAQQSIPGCPSIAGVVATVGRDFATYPGSLRLQESRQEVSHTPQAPPPHTLTAFQIIADLESMVKERLLAFYNKSNCLPHSILFFRDGVSESQFVHVKELELSAVRAGCVRAFQRLSKHDAAIGKMASYDPLITVVIVGKRHQTRFFPTKGTYNHPPGLVVDTEVCHPSYFDFYLQAHASGQGTARSAHYFVVHDEMGFSADELQQLVRISPYLAFPHPPPPPNLRPTLPPSTLN